MTLDQKKIDTFLLSDDFEQIALKNDLSYFAERILNLEIVNHHVEWGNLVNESNRISILASRDSGKSFYFSFAYPIWRAYHHWIPEALSEGYKSIPRVSLGYIFSNTQDQAIKHLDIIKHELMTNSKLIHLIPNKKETWSKQEIKLSNGAIIRARGWGTAVRGGHPCWLVADDSLSEDNLYSELIRKKEKDYFFSAITNMIVPGGQIIVIGTPLHKEDLYGDLSINPSYKFKVFPICDDKFDNLLWPSRYPKQTLIRMKEEIGSIRFARERQCVPISEASSIFPDHILRECFDPNFEMPTHITDEERSRLQVFTGVDLAMSATVAADFTVIITIGVDEHKNKWILDIRRKKGLPLTEQLREIQDVYNAFKPQKIFIEDNNFQRIFKDELVRNTDLPVFGFTTTRYNKNSLETGVPSLQILFENKKIIIPRKTNRCRRLTDLLLNELKCFTYVDGKLQSVTTHDDAVMAFWIAVEASRSSAFNFGFA